MQRLQCRALSTLFKQLEMCRHLQLVSSSDAQICWFVFVKHQHLMSVQTTLANEGPLVGGSIVIMSVKKGKNFMQDDDNQLRLAHALTL